jgi:hypothetical protein
LLIVPPGPVTAEEQAPSVIAASMANKSRRKAEEDAGIMICAYMK